MENNGVTIKEPNWPASPDYCKPLPNSSDAGAIPPSTQIKDGGKYAPHMDSPKTMNWLKGGM